MTYLYTIGNAVNVTTLNMFQHSIVKKGKIASLGNTIWELQTSDARPGTGRK